MTALLSSFLETNQPALDALAFTLLHFCWQAALAALLYMAHRHLIAPARVYSAQAHYAVAVSLLVSLLLAPVVTLLTLVGNSPMGFVQPLAVLAPIPPAAAAGDLSPLPYPVSWTVYTVALWLLGVLAFTIRFSLGLRHWRRTRVAAQPLRDPVALARVSQIAAQLGWLGSLNLRVSAAISSPVVIGFFRYTLLVPVTFFSSLTAAQADAILAHELAHIRRRDGLVNLLQMVVETLFFFHPAVWWLSKQVRLEREKACDWMAASAVGDKTTYAEALLALEELRLLAGPLALGARNGSLEDRVRHLFQVKSAGQLGHGWMAAGLGLGAMLLGAVSWTIASPPAQPQRLVAVRSQSAGAQTPMLPATRVPAAAPHWQPVVAAAPLAFPSPDAPVRPAPLPVPVEASSPMPSPTPPPTPSPTPSQAATQQPPTNSQREQRLEAMRRELVEGAYKRWVLEDVVYLITNEELAAYQRLGTDAERERFITQFWERRDPSPGTAANEFKEEHYRRITYANDRFGEGSTDGWRSERGRIYIQFGPPDVIEAHPPDNYQRWYYRQIPGVGNKISFEFGERPQHLR